MKKAIIFLILLTGSVFFISGCATHSIGELVDPPGFLKGLLHGFIILFSFVGSLFTDYTIYAFPNSGGWYDFGFIIGIMMFFGGGGASTRKKRC